MNKNLEKEYINQIQNDVPDLWSRIEAGLEEKTLVTQGQNVKKQRKKRTFFIGGGIMAAGLCMAVAIPVFIRTIDKNSSMDMATSIDASTNAVTAEREMFVGAEANEQQAEDAAEAFASNCYEVCVHITEVREYENGMEYEALVLAQETGKIELASTIVLRPMVEEEDWKIEPQQEYTMIIMDSGEEYYFIQNVKN